MAYDERGQARNVRCPKIRSLPRLYGRQVVNALGALVGGPSTMPWVWPPPPSNAHCRPGERNQVFLGPEHLFQESSEHLVAACSPPRLEQPVPRESGPRATLVPSAMQDWRPRCDGGQARLGKPLPATRTSGIRPPSLDRAQSSEWLRWGRRCSASASSDLEPVHCEVCTGLNNDEDGINVAEVRSSRGRIGGELIKGKLGHEWLR